MRLPRGQGEAQRRHQHGPLQPLDDPAHPEVSRRTRGAVLIALNTLPLLGAALYAVARIAGS